MISARYPCDTGFQNLFDKVLGKSKLISSLLPICSTKLSHIDNVYCINQYNYAGFYRKQPYIGNLVTLALECWNIALTIGYVLARVAKISVCAIFYFGRMDTPVLAEGGLGGKRSEKRQII